MRTRPYRNSYIITVIGDMFFSGGSGSFAARHEALFPKHDDGTSVTREVPIVMVSIVATGVSTYEHLSKFTANLFFLAICCLSRVAER